MDLGQRFFGGLGGLGGGLENLSRQSVGMDLGEKFCIARNSLTIPASVSLYDSHNKGAQLNFMVTLIEVSAGSTLKRGARVTLYRIHYY